MRSRRTSLARLTLCTAVLLIALQPIQAQTTWTGASGFTWGTAGSWSAGVPNATTEARFTGTAPGTITLGTAASSFLNLQAGGYTLDAGTLTLGNGTTALLTNSAGANTISGRLVATGLTGTISGGTLNLTNTATGAGANSITGTFIVNASATLAATFAGTVGTGTVSSPTSTDVGSNPLGSAAVTLNGGTLNLQGRLIAGGATGQFYDMNSVATVTTLINNNGFTGFGNGRSDFFVNNPYPTASGGVLTGTTDRSRGNAFLNSLTAKVLGSGAPAGTTAVNTGGSIVAALTPPADLANFYLGGLSFPNAGDGRVFGQATTTTFPGPPTLTTNVVNVGQYAQTNHLARFYGVLNITSPGAYSFDTSSDDGSIVYIDGRLVVYNNNDQGAAGFLLGRFGPINFSGNPATIDSVNLTAGAHTIEVLYQQGGGGAAMTVNYTGPDTGGSVTPVPASALSGTQGLVTLGNNITLQSSSTINVTRAHDVRFGALTFNSGLTLTTGTSTSFGNAYVRMNGGTTFANAAGGTYTINALGSNDIGLGTLTNAGGTANIVKTGPNNLILDGSTAALGGGSLNFEVRDGRLLVVNTITAGPTFANPLGAGTIVTLNTTGTTINPASIMFRPFNNSTTVTNNPNIDFANRINVLQNSVLEAAPFLPSSTAAPNLTLTNMRLTGVGTPAIALSIPAATTLTADIYGGGLNFWIQGGIIGSGTLLKGAYPSTNAPPNNSAAAIGSTQFLVPPMYNGTGTLFLDADNSGFSGTMVVNTGTLVARNANALGASGTTIRVSGSVTYNANDGTNTINSNTQGGGTLGFENNPTFPATAPTITLDGGTLANRSGTTNYNGNIVFGSTPVSRVYAPLVPAPNATINSGSGTLVLNGTIDYVGVARTLNKTGGATVQLGGAALNMVTGTVISHQAGTLNSNNALAFGGIADVQQSAGSTLNINATQTVGALNGAGTTNLNGNVLTVGAANNLNGNYAGNIANGTPTGGSVVKNGTGTWTLSGNSTFSGGIRVNTGVLYPSSTGGMGTGTTTLAGGTLRLGFPVSTGTPTLSGFGGSGTGWQLNGSLAGFPNVASDVLNLTNNVASTASSAFNQTQQTLPTVGFEAKFRFQFVTGSGNPADGFTFALQNAGAGASALGGNGGGMGYSGITPSVALLTNIYNPNTRGLRITTNGTTGTPYVAMTPVNPIDASPGTPVDYTVSYYDGVLTASLVQGANTFSASAPVNINAVLGGNLAYIGFTGGTGGENAAMRISNFTFTPLTYNAPVSYANPVTALASTTSTINTINTTVSLGALQLQNSAVVNVAADSAAPANTAYALNFGATTLVGSSTLNVANNGTGTGTVGVGALGDGGTAATLNKTGPGTLALTAAVGTITNGTVINLTTGTLTSNANAVGQGAVAMSSGTTFNVGANQTVGMLTGQGNVNLGANTLTVGTTNNLSGTYSGVIGGTGGVTKAGNGTFYLNGINTYTGPTNVNAGTLGGTGTIAGNVIVNSGGTLNPGNSPGKLTVNGSVTFTGGTFLAELNGTGQGTTYDWLAAGGAVSLGAGVAQLTTTLGYTPSGSDSLTIITGSSVTGTFANAPTNGQLIGIGTFGGTFYYANINYNPASVVLNGFTPIPEPAHLLLLCGGVAGGWRLLRRKRAATNA